MNTEQKLEIKQYLLDNLALEVETISEYTGGMDGGSMYKDTYRFKLVIDGEVISEEYVG